ncbi:triphosphoribosyl-dephospho-CoA synthase MdcB [Psychrobacter sp. LV10R520-6]|uniref:triphosphoribosyl-dephospho-CoA synthase MdcB n=1 Tax=Psychrobacter sp. LV10R520-6 TaxID=1415574 RepID=UPI0024C7846E|nr:triphosphoribosyl-dephospho-CoA synthase MdcB [Psychrobacter sp. LV10R520-6]SNT70972.1 triphosphoribosyl-dephospho-CoA synthase [Psychrobacter sp. LV10R520-6]
MSVNTFLEPTNETLSSKQAIWQQIDDFALDALYDELNLENKPGLVCPSGNGSHSDMNYDTFMASITSLREYFATLSEFGYENRPFDDLKNKGIYQEVKMRKATNNINTHKGAIFNLGFASAAIGKCLQNNEPLTTQNICAQIVHSWQYDLTHSLERKADSHGQQMYKKYGVTGAIEMVSNGFQIIQNIALPCFYDTFYRTQDFEKAAMQTLMTLISALSDTNLVWRGGMTDLTDAQMVAKQFLQAGGVHQPNWRQAVSMVNQYFIHRNLSPGGSADLLAVTIFFYKVENEFNNPV